MRDNAGADGRIQAEILDLRVERDAARIAELQADPRVDIAEHLETQAAELREVRPVVSDIVGEPGRWVYFSWRRTMVSLLGPESFRLLRLDRNRNKITRQEQALFTRLSVGVIGLSVGHAIAHTLALEGLCGQLRLADFDSIELSNLNRIPATVFDLSQNKAEVAARRIAELDPYLSVSVVDSGVTESNIDEFLTGLDVVIEECDSLDVKMLVRDRARRLGIPVLMETSDRGLLDVERFDLEPDRPLFHGLTGDLDHAGLQGLSNRDKVPFVLKIVDAAGLSARMAASMVEVEETLTSWPQLGSDVALGGATVAAAVRRLGRGAALPSGRVRVDLDARLDELAGPAPAPPTRSPDDGDDLTEVPIDPRAAVVHAARLAPSGGNVQPWLIESDAESLRIGLAAERTSAMDVGFRGSYVAIGAALFNARVAASHHRVLGEVSVPSSADGPVAVLRYGSGADDGLTGMYDAMLRRISNRHPGTGAVLPPAVGQVLRAAAEAEGGGLEIVTDRGRLAEIATVLGCSDRIRFLTPVLHEQMMSELRVPGLDPLSTGLDVRTMELDTVDLAKVDIARRADAMAELAAWDAGRALGYPTRDRVLSSSAVVVVTVPGTSRRHYVAGGAAVERVWIEAERQGFAVQPVSPVFLFANDRAEIDALSSSFADEIGHLRTSFTRLSGVGEGDAMALVLRLGRARAASFRSRRLSAETVLRESIRTGP